MKRITQLDMFGRKECSECWRVLPLDQFVRDTRKSRGVTSNCKVCRARATSRWRVENPGKAREYNARPEARAARLAWWERNGHIVNARKRAERATPEGKAKAAAQARAHRRASEAYRVKSNLRGRINFALSGRKRTRSVEQLIGCSIPDFVAHLESLWEPGMSWGNYGLGLGRWQIDHIVPCAAFDLSDENQQRECFHYTNCQPLWARDNRAKGARHPDELGSGL